MSHLVSRRYGRSFNIAGAGTFHERRDFSPNAQVQFDFALPVGNTTNTTNSLEWTVPYLSNNTHIRNSSAFFVRVQTTSYSGVFGATPPLAGTFGPFAIDMKKAPPPGYVLPNAPDYLGGPAQGPGGAGSGNVTFTAGSSPRYLTSMLLLLPLSALLYHTAEEM